MTGRQGAAAVRRRLLAVAAAGCAAAMLAGPAVAAAPADAAAAPASAVLETTAANVNVHRLPDLYASRQSVIASRGTRITVTCWAHGSVVNGNVLWYHISGPTPHLGFVAAALTTGALRVPAGVPQCVIWSQIFHTTGGDVHVRSGPGTHFPSLHVIASAGTNVRIICWALGTPVNGEGWYLITSPFDGYVAGAFLNTPHSRVPGSPAC